MKALGRYINAHNKLFPTSRNRNAKVNQNPIVHEEVLACFDSPYNTSITEVVTNGKINIDTLKAYSLNKCDSTTCYRIKNVLCFLMASSAYDAQKSDIDDIYNQFLALNKKNLPSKSTAFH